MNWASKYPNQNTGRSVFPLHFLGGESISFSLPTTRSTYISCLESSFFKVLNNIFKSLYDTFSPLKEEARGQERFTLSSESLHSAWEAHLAHLGDHLVLGTELELTTYQENMLTSVLSPVFLLLFLHIQSLVLKWIYWRIKIIFPFDDLQLCLQCPFTI